MKKLSSLIHYELETSIKFICYFYAIEYTILFILNVPVFMKVWTTNDISISGLELNTVIFVAVVAFEGFYEDFRMLIQNGFTRKYIFISTISLFTLIAGLMSMVDTIMGNILSKYNGYYSLFQGIYGNEQSFFHNWLFLFLAYLLICSITYLIILIYNKVGKKLFMYMVSALGLFSMLVIPLLLKTAVTKGFMDKAMELFLKSFGFMRDGTINFMYPIISLLLVIGIISTAAYYVNRKTEVRN